MKPQFESNPTHELPYFPHFFEESVTRILGRFNPSHYGRPVAFVHPELAADVLRHYGRIYREDESDYALPAYDLVVTPNAPHKRSLTFQAFDPAKRPAETI